MPHRFLPAPADTAAGPALNHLDESSQSRQQQIFTVTRLNSAVRMILEQDLGLVWLTGELSNLAMPSSGHWYFSLKDISAQVRCAMFKGNNRRVPFRPQDGMQVLVQARVSLYEPRGDYQLIIESMQPAGDGMLALRFEELKRRLGAEGLFDEGRKRPLPREPRAVGLVTSATGAASGSAGIRQRQATCRVKNGATMPFSAPRSFECSPSAPISSAVSIWLMSLSLICPRRRCGRPSGCRAGAFAPAWVDSS